MIRILLQSFLIGFLIITYEIILARALTPYIGSNVITWSLNICFVLTGLSIGSYLQLTKKFKDLLLGQILVWALIATLIPGVEALFNHLNSTKLGYLSISTALYLAYAVLPNIVWGYAYSSLFRSIEQKESAIRVLIFNSVGNVVGAIFLQVLMLTYLDITIEQSVWIVVLIAVMSFGIGYLKKGLYKKTVFLIGFAVSILTAVSSQFATSPYFQKLELIDKFDTLYHRVQVFKTSEGVGVANDIYGLQSVAERYQSGHAQVLDVFKIRPQIKKILLLGVGGGGMIFEIQKSLYQQVETKSSEPIEIIAIEIDQEMHQKTHHKLSAVVQDQIPQEAPIIIKYIYEDARFYLNSTQTKFDLIIMDVYQEFAPPHHLITEEFYKTIHNRLSDEGLFFANLLSYYDKELNSKSRFFYRSISTLRKSFKGYSMGVKPIGKQMERMGMGNFSVILSKSGIDLSYWGSDIPHHSLEPYRDDKEDSFIDISKYMLL